MRRTFIVGILLLLCGGISARSKPAGAAKSDAVMFVFLRVDSQKALAVLRPMIAPDIGVQLDSGTRKLEQGAVLRCESSLRERDALVENQIAKISELLLDCGDQKFVVKTIEFSPRAK